MEDKMKSLVNKLDEITSGRGGAFTNGFVTSEVQAITLHRAELEQLCKSISSEFTDGSSITISEPKVNKQKDGFSIFISKFQPSSKEDKMKKVDWS